MVKLRPACQYMGRISLVGKCIVIKWQISCIFHIFSVSEQTCIEKAHIRTYHRGAVSHTAAVRASLKQWIILLLFHPFSNHIRQTEVCFDMLLIMHNNTISLLSCCVILCDVTACPVMCCVTHLPAALYSYSRNWSDDTEMSVIATLHNSRLPSILFWHFAVIAGLLTATTQAC